MSDNQQNHDNVASDDTIDVEGRIRELKIDKNDTNNDEEEEEIVVAKGENRVASAVAESNQYPNRPNEPNCIYYLRTRLCGYGDACKFNHPSHADVNTTAAVTAEVVQDKGELPQRDGRPVCGYFLKTGSCKYGSNCKYHHPRDRAGADPAPLNILGLPMREGEKCCPYYMRTYTCKFGAVCKFNHPQPASVDTTSSNPNSAGLTSAILPYVGAIPAWSLPKPPYLPGPHVSGPNNYMLFVYPHQGMMAPHGWSTYAGNLNPVVAPGYNSPHEVELPRDGQLELASSDYFNLPMRPDQPECRYFMSNGSCKYGSGCKYHHPRERIAQLAMNKLGPHGLPLRPGQAMCTHFGSYGVCKYGTTCKYDHPVAGYFSNYDFGFPDLPMVDQSLRRNLIKNSSDTSPPKSVKITEWIKKPEIIDQGKENSDAESLEDHQHGHQPVSSEGESCI